MGIFGKSRARLILDHHAEVEDLRRIIADQAAEIGRLSSMVENLRAMAARREERADAALEYATRLRTGCIGLASSWDRLGLVGTYRMAAIELRGLLEQLDEPTATIDQPPLTIIPGGSDT